MKRISTLYVIAALLLFVAAQVSAQSFDYVTNPSNNYLKTFTGGSFDKIDDNPNTAKTGYFFMQTVAMNRFCMGSGMNATYVTTISNTGSKNGGNCNNVTDVIVNMYVDNQNYYLTPYAKIGDYDKVNEHISVVPFKYYNWISTKASPNNNQLLCQKSTQSGGADACSGNTGYPCMAHACDPESLFPYDAFYLNNKEGVCSNEVKTALIPALKSSYYSHPEDFYLPGYGTITSTNCNDVMFPEKSGSRDRVNGLYMDNPSVFHSLYYDDQYQYTGYPFYIYRVEYDCYNVGKLVTSGSTDMMQSTTQGLQGDIYSKVWNEPKYPAGQQFYDWSRINSFVLGTAENNDLMTKKDVNGGYYRNPREINQMHVQFSCPVGTTSYSVTAVLKKNPASRFKSPVDYTYQWGDVFTTSGSRLYSGVASLSDKKSEYLVYSQLGGYIIGNVPSSVPVQNNDMNNTVTETNYSTTTTTVDKPTDCFSCTQNNSIGNITLNGNGGTQSGGSVIQNGADDSAVSDLTQQAIGQEQQAAKQNFIDKLVELGKAILVVIIILYSIVGLLLFIYFIFAFFMIPGRMKQSIIDIFNAGMRGAKK